MNKLAIATVAVTIFGATAATANELTWVAGAEYAIEADTAETTAGLEYAVNDFTFAPLLTVNDASGSFDYAETTVGFAVRF